MIGSVSRTFRTYSAPSLATLVLLWVLLIHAAGLYLFTKGFLLTRLALDNKTPQSVDPLPPTHSKLVLLIIDSLRFDFITPNPPENIDPHHHKIFTIPAELTASQPDRSFIFNAYSDPPTATLQRIKGITTGSLPTFVDIGSNFAGSEIKEDSLIQQFKANGKRIAFMGDDTWTSVYPTMSTNMTWPYDSFNVEDLHSVDEGVIKHLFPLLRNQGSWDVAIGHFLGVDHAGHRVGPSGEVMRSKLKQMDEVLRDVVELLADDTLLVVLGDHGMDAKGDHGGDGALETSSAMWIYSKGAPLAVVPHPSDVALPSITFPGCTTPHRFIQQIDVVPTIAILLGIPVPFNNLGMVIPELFLRPGNALPQPIKPSKQVVFDLPELSLSKALRINVNQVHAYLDAYRRSPAGTELDSAWSQLTEKYEGALNDSAQGCARSQGFLRDTLAACRAIWAQFNVVLMCSGLAVLALSVPTLLALYRAVDGPPSLLEDVLVVLLSKGISAGAVGFVLGGVANIGLQLVLPVFSHLQAGILGAALGAELSVLASQKPWMLTYVPTKATIDRTFLPILILLLHSLSYTSNSFLMWEDRICQFFLFTLLGVSLVKAPSAPTRDLRLRLSGYTVVAATLVRLLAMSTVCREEQQPYCHVTFYASSTTPVAPLITSFGAPFGAYILPRIIRWFLSRSKSDRGVAPLFLHSIWQPLLVGGSMYWLLDRLESWEGLNPNRVPLVQTVRMLVARFALGGSIIGCGVLWWFSGPCVEMEKKEVVSGARPRMQITVIGFANAYGSSYLLFLLSAFALVFAVSQPTAQVVLILGLITFLLHLDINDGQSDAAALVEAFEKTDITKDELKVAPQKPTFMISAFLSILSMQAFYSTGHQAVMSTIQWKTAFIGFPVVNYFFSPILVVLNTFGPIGLFALAAPLYALWKVEPPRPQSGPHSELRVLSNVLKISIGVSFYHSTLTLGTAASAALLRRHLMVWKVFAPRYMLGGISLLVVDAALVFGMGIGVTNVMGKLATVTLGIILRVTFLVFSGDDDLEEWWWYAKLRLKAV